jgi:uncharacterized protein (UPF0332 family)
MNLSELLKKEIIKKIEKNKLLAFELIEKSKKDIKASEDNLKTKNFDWSLAISYNSMLSAGRALMAFKGFITSSKAHHLGVIQFCATSFPNESSGLIALFNKYRIRRHNVVYGETGSISKSEAKNAIENAEKFLKKVKEKINF